jgi:hypothetical protein
MVFTNATLFSILFGCLMSDTLHSFSSTSNIFVVACYYTCNEKQESMLPEKGVQGVLGLVASIISGWEICMRTGCQVVQ